MDDGAPGLEVGFQIDTGGSLAEIFGLESAMDSAEARITRDAALIERATSGMVKLGGATAEVTTFGNATDRATQTARAAYARTEKQVESLIRSLERKTAVYGLSKDEAQALRVEELALAAATQGNTDAAQRLNAAYSGLYDKQFAAMRRTRAEAEALAQTREAEANATAAAAARQAQELRSAALAHAMFNARVKEGAQAMREQEAAQRALDMERQAQEVRSAALAYNLFEQRAREGAKAMREAEAAQRAADQQRQASIMSAEAYAQRLATEAQAIGKTTDELREMEVARRAADADAAGMGDQAARIRAAGAAYAAAQAQAAGLAAEQHRLAEAERAAALAAREAAQAQAMQDASLNSLRSSVDPLFASQQRLMRELESAARLYRQGAIGQEEYGRSSETLAQRLDEVQRAQARQAQGSDEAVRGAKLGANDLTNIAFQIQDIIVSLQGGQKPLTVLMQQGSQLGGIMMQTGASFGDMVRAVVGLAIVSRPTAAAAAALAEAEAARAAAHTAAGTAGSRAAIAAAELVVAEEAAARAAVGDTAAQNALALARLEAASSAEIAAAANRQLAASQAAATASSEAAAASATRSLAPWLRTLSAYAVPIAAVGVGVYALNQNMNDHAAIEEYARTLGLTKAEMKKLGDQSVTTGDMLTGLAATMGFSLDGVGTTVKGWVVDLGNFFGEVIKGISAATYGLFVGSYRAIVETWRQWPATLGDLFVQAANGAIKAVQWLANASIDALNAISPFEKLDHVNFGQMENRFAGAGRATGQAWARNLDGAVKEALDGIDGFMGRWTTNSQKAARDRLKKEADKIIADRPDRKEKPDRHAEALMRDAEATEAQIRNLYALGEAYGVSGAAALIAEARVKAESAAIKKRGDVEAMVDRQVRLSIAQRVSDAAKSTATLRDQTAAQAAVNAMVEAGLVPASRAADLVRGQIEDLPLLAAAQAAQQRGLATEAGIATAALEKQRAARAAMDAASRTAAFNTADAAGKARLAELAEELRLVGATDMARARALATIRATQEAEAFNAQDRASHIAQQVAIAESTERLALATRDWNDSLSYSADRWDAIARNAQDAARGMADAFGEVGRAIGDTASIFASYVADQERLKIAHDAQLAAARSLGTEAQRTAAVDRATSLYHLRTMTAQVGLYGDMALAARGLFKEESDGYRVASAAMKAFRAVEFALSVRAIAQDAIETGAKVATSAARAAANAIEAVTKAIASLPFPANLAAGAATVAALAAVGVTIAGSFGGRKSALEKANDGSGTVFGDGKAQSESIRRALDALKEVDTLMLGTSREMAASLRSIESQIGGVAALVVRAGNVNANGTVSEGFQRNLIGSVLGKVPLIGGLLGGLFGSSTKIIGGGLYGSAQSLGDILSGGFDASYYSDTQKTKKFFGIKTGTSYSTSYTGADSALEDQFTLILRDFNSAILAAAGPLGAATSDIQARLNGFVVNLGKIDLQGLTGEQIQEKLTAVFGAAADRMAGAAFPGVERFQKVGEGAFETLVRVASTVETVTASLDQLGFAARGLGIDAKMGLAGQFESLSAMTQAAGAYFEAFYTPAEQNAARLSQMTDVFVRMGVTMPTTLSGFRALVEAQDLNTAAGQAAYATLLQLAPAFADLQSAMTGAKSAADILAERQDLERQMLELSGNTEAIRALDLARLDASNRALQQQVWAVKDAQDAAKAADDLRKSWSDVGASIEEEIRRIRGLNDTTGGSSFMALQGQFNAQSALARGGDQEAAKLLPSLSQALLKAAGDSATSRQELDRIQAATASSLEATFAAIQRFSAAAAATPAASAQRVLSAMEAAPITGVTGAPVYDDMASEIRRLREEVALMRAENNTGNATIASNTSKTARTLENVTSASGGEAIAVASAA